ncbi:MAG TPA: hydrogenase maturation nickel metallochaperone HypA [Trinickia sp.]|uniref:hydrogenase maturation nickel metallochaperone HypA n=1 Tax=Trinickia sp. TaxID=2571163 RepID=UPI002CBE9B53|nr:hydrogenase maturation nickel metallochaperone HypA [Trinickia sp.]HVW51180.1 hydrogenase maturation nickel metallochaperone HypA [Trinickia sp.]
MHETGVVRNLVRQLEMEARKNGAIRVRGVGVWLGALSQFSPEHFREHFIDEACGTLAEGATLRIEASRDVIDPHAQDVMMTSIEFDVYDGKE